MLTSVDRSLELDVEEVAPDRYRDLERSLEAPRVIARGTGLSYVPLSFGEGVRSIRLDGFNRILTFDPEACLVTVEAGITLGRLFQFLTPRNFMLAVQPGHPLITIGGCMAADVHGKDQYREGLFHTIVESLILLDCERGRIRLSRHEHPDLFHLTLGGFGLTGFIVEATLRLKPLPGKSMRLRHISVSSLAQTFTVMEGLREESSLLYSWNDFCGSSPGRGVVVTGLFDQQETEEKPGQARLNPAAGRCLPRFWRPSTVRTAITLYRRSLLKQPERLESLYRAFYPLADKALYYVLYGRSGLAEQQVVVPGETVQQYAKALEELAARYPRGLVVAASCKLFTGESELLRFTGDGVALTLDVPRTRQGTDFFAQMDSINQRFGARTNLAKDSRIDPTAARGQYAQWDAFQQSLREHDPKGRFASHFSKRLGL